jgi:transposase-like protein
MTIEERRRRRFSEEFRKQQVVLIESGKTTVSEVSKLYEVKTANVRRWLKKYGKKKLPEPILITNADEYGRIKRLEAEVKKLKEIIGDQQVELIVKSELIRLAEEKLGEDLKKK